MFRAETAETEEEGDKWYDDHDAGRRPPELLPRDEVARAINAEVKAGRGTAHGGVYLDIATRRSAEFIPGDFLDVPPVHGTGGVDITREAMEIGPTCHYIMGGIQVDADTAATAAAGLFAAGECAGGLHGRTASAATRSATSWSSAAGRHGRSDYAEATRRQRPGHERSGGCRYRGPRALRAHHRREPYDIQRDLQEMMQSNVGIIRTGSEIDEALSALEVFNERVRNIAVKAAAYNPGWNLATDLPSMLSLSRSVATARRTARSRAVATPATTSPSRSELGKINFAQTSDAGTGTVPSSSPSRRCW